jgi:hypothetical protein
VDLGEAAPIDSAVARLFGQIQMGHRDSPILRTALHELDELVYVRLARYLTNVSHLVVCPDGQLCRLPFEMLSHEGRYMVESMAVSYVDWATPGPIHTWLRERLLDAAIPFSSIQSISAQCKGEIRPADFLLEHLPMTQEEIEQCR